MNSKWKPYLFLASFPLLLVPFSIWLSTGNQYEQQSPLVDPEYVTQWQLMKGKTPRSLPIQNDY